LPASFWEAGAEPWARFFISPWDWWAFPSWPAYILQPSFGFLIGFIAGAFTIGKVLEENTNLTLSRTLFALVLGQGVIYLFGLSYLYLNLNFILKKPISFSSVFAIGFLIFIPGDVVKTIIAALLMAPIRRGLFFIKR
jgi:biotin transport system substrate-specific component